MIDKKTLEAYATIMNKVFFDNLLEVPAIVLVNNKSYWGKYWPPSHTFTYLPNGTRKDVKFRPSKIVINTDGPHPLSTLLHELVHVWQYKTCCAQHGFGTWHDRNFQKMARKVGICEHPYSYHRDTNREKLHEEHLSNILLERKDPPATHHRIYHQVALF